MSWTGEERSADHWEDALASLDRYDLAAGADADRSAAALIAPAPLSVLRTGGPADDLVEAWRATQRRSKDSSPEIWLAALAAFDAAFQQRPYGIERALAERRMRLGRTQLEVKLRLGGQLFYFGRLAARAGHAHARPLLGDAINTLDQVARGQAQLPANTRRGFTGMRGIAALLLSRDAERPDRSRLVDDAAGYLLAAERLGDRSGGHFAYLIEALLRRHELTGDPAALAEAESAWQRAQRSDRIRSLLTVAAELRETEAIAALARGDAGRGVEALIEAEALLSEALTTDGGASGIDDGFVHVVRGRVRHRLFEHHTAASGARRAHWLTLSEQDLAAPGTRPHLSASTEIPVLIDRARRLQRRGQHQEALAALDAADSLAEQLPPGHGLAAQARVARLDSELFLAVTAGDEPTVERHLGTVLELTADTPVPAAAVTLGARFLLARRPDDPLPRKLAEEAVARLADELTSSELPPNARHHIAGHAARLAWILAREADDPQPLARAAKLFGEAISDPADSSPTLLADAGSCALRLAKLQIDAESPDHEEIAGLLQDAADWLDTALSRAAEVSYRIDESFEPPLLHSRAGEAYGRLDAMTRRDEHLARAIDHLQQARQLGHPWEQLAGHLGDALYRRGRRSGSVADLGEAIRLKDEDHAAGRAARENRSVAAAAAVALFQLTGDPAELDRAASYALEASRQDPAWPWPPLQLAEIARLAGRPMQLAPNATPAAAAAGLTALGEDPDALERYAAELAAATPEFAPSPLAGQTRGGRAVYVLADRHGLLERTLVLKRLPNQQAESEAETTRSFGIYLADSAAPAQWQLPHPVAVIPHPTQPDKAVYVMRRAQGATLGDLLLADGPEAAGEYLEHAVRFLAAYCAWASRDRRAPDSLSPRRVKSLSAALHDRASGLGLSKSTSNRVAKGLRAALADETPAVAKKDAHAANWLVTHDGALVALDLEATAAVPVLWEVAQLIDDYPFLPADADGWHRRLSLCRAHLHELAVRGRPVHLDDDRLNELLAWFSFAHATASIGRLRASRGDWRVSNSGRDARRARLRHAVDMLVLLADTAADVGLRYAATQLVARYRA
jgi:hypothetical protein